MYSDVELEGETTARMPLHRWTPLLLAGAGAFSSCAHVPVRLATPCVSASARLFESWRELQDARQSPGGCDAEDGVHCERLRIRIQRLSMDCASSPDVVMANALLAFDDRDFVRAQQLLDELFSLQVTYPEAAILRGRIALEQGNIPFALRFLDQQVRQMGDHGPLRETYASALFLAGRWDEARAQLGVAQRLGSPGWRVAYGEGLIEEAAGRPAEARQRYQEALQARPEWKAAASRLRALEVAGKPQK